MTSIIIDSHFIIDSNKVPEKKTIIAIRWSLPHTIRQKQRKSTRFPKSKSKPQNNKSVFIEGAQHPLTGSELFRYEIVRLNKFDYAHPKRTRSKWKISRNPLIV
jgi:hypothetical protein